MRKALRAMYKLEKKVNTPIFIISFNRKDYLEQSIRSYHQLENSTVIIHDNGSDDEETLAYLERLEAEGITVNRSAKITAQAELNNVNQSIERYFLNHKKADYIVTDPDIQLLTGAQNTISIYKYFLKKFKDIESIGPMLKIDDIPRRYPLYNETINRHVAQFWQHKPQILKCKNEEIAYLPCPIDTTFSMHRAGAPFKRLTKGIRLYGQYSARHLDWYDPLAFERTHYRNAHSDIAHWSNNNFYDEFKDEPLKYTSYYDVKSDSKNLVVITRKVKGE